jgi:hypothetical protein
LGNDGFAEWQNDLINELGVKVGPKPMKSGIFFFGLFVITFKLSWTNVGKDESLFTFDLDISQDIFQPLELAERVIFVWFDQIVTLVVDVCVQANQVKWEFGFGFVNNIITTFQ